MKNRVTELLGIKYPIIQGGMVYLSRAPLTNTVSEAGGLGTIAAGGLTAEQLALEIDKVKGLTDKPFGVNIPLLNELAVGLVRVAVDKRVPVVILSAGKPDKYIPLIKAKGLRVIQVVPNVAMAKKVEAAGVDAVIAEGVEGGGHLGPDELTTMVLIPQVADAVKIPVIAAGGIAESRGFVAALALGAEGIQVGTAFAAAIESPGHDNYKKAILDADDRATIVTGRGFGMMVREIRNDFAEQVLELETQGASKEEILKYIGEGRTYKAIIDGDMVEGSIMCGQVAGMITKNKHVRDIFDDLLGGTDEIINRLQWVRSK